MAVTRIDGPPLNRPTFELCGGVSHGYLHDVYPPMLTDYRYAITLEVVPEEGQEGRAVADLYDLVESISKPDGTIQYVDVTVEPHRA